MAQVFISLGSNINKAHYIQAANTVLALHLTELTFSSVFESEAVGFSGKNFYNSVVGGNTTLELREFCQLLKKIEREHGRKDNDKKFSPRTLDLDLLFYDDLICEIPAQIPRDEITKNAFVLWPLVEVAPNLIHPVLQKSIADIWQAYDKTQQKLWKVELPVV
ncbi:2-amino-4-hydroxy-6-hydroxymethyldihydropteridine diphosphokinase [Pseudoalteromonas tunicata]|jgi:2-amino-4-hydroxy-6-hydroxymethyldihydropteridine diphosphokinase|uniref:2-amino-4-hydroxy-6-hydroxymethyldihydropteridine diphosphokinase n=1 Tax=Pseudoalteromonas tunicata D2 TaxID=87626 RepID=A4C775_9GAMM|nr:2-amino-4-hydroxy-6-hydroxymethyldihydropteridine diphosphokinase [Pseudoalteromonas tunicata]ATC95800.1 2-amino-4-hydroxy-6-hydroxymethyldihydropteridine diphosphokinase [Pseudoalteromonas tunicata]AXT31346.1 2-amino-4-hydroxy-6-hydroxymethyldihydropteridine diphosphokinase [Pseudoalteromonas tunicata]EAR29829.1 putative phosphokinase [Pseudoalteromonas tunicata D2]MDP4984080.1 2-amino-4-hydroxy-6-hydroxymethyldihydropteridine diphosphokinase [Pseudoalteromonas tunicata]MDP5214396.1 2-amin